MYFGDKSIVAKFLAVSKYCDFLCLHLGLTKKWMLAPICKKKI